ncbi:unnamed protein product [Phyllotreta striolata]|uniref:Uncharacterized protein n=1 Tax=Phyllotreta striolata TaxID=444603 RepID=A0A9N9TG26_PHYSR|nr:unnamed protein product [Phyllotreta striolata]
MAFDLKKKVAVITGGASGIGLCYAKALLTNGVQAVTLADVNPEYGNKAIREIDNEFGINRAIFVQCDVRNIEDLERVFYKTVEKFKFVDILINNAGILNDAIWENQIAINVNGTVNGILVAMDKFFPKYKQSGEGVIVNIASITGIDFHPHVPIYSGTKSAVVGFTKSWGVREIYDQKKTRFVAVAPGVTLTPLILDIHGRNLGPVYEQYLREKLDNGMYPTQEPEHVANELVKVVKHAENGSVWVVEGGEPAFEYIPVDPRLQRKKNVLKIK